MQTYSRVGASLVAQMVKTACGSGRSGCETLGWEDPLEKGVTTHSSILAGESPWTEEPGRLQSVESQSVGHD